MGAGVPRVPPKEATTPSGHVGLWLGQPGPLGGTGSEKLAVQVSPGRQRHLSLEGHPCRPPLGPDRPLWVGSRGSEAPLWRPEVACGAGELLGRPEPRVCFCLLEPRRGRGSPELESRGRERWCLAGAEPGPGVPRREGVSEEEERGRVSSRGLDPAHGGFWGWRGHALGLPPLTLISRQ